jgi:hypothetical protein
VISSENSDPLCQSALNTKKPCESCDPQGFRLIAAR